RSSAYCPRARRPLLSFPTRRSSDLHVLDAAGDLVVAVRGAAGDVAGVQPALLVDDGGGGLGHLVVALHDVVAAGAELAVGVVGQDRKSTRLNSSHVSISYAVFCLKK